MIISVIILILSSAISPKEANIMAIILGMQGIILAFKGAVGPRETNIIVVIPSMHRIMLAFNDASVLVLVMHHTLSEHVISSHQSIPSNIN